MANKFTLTADIPADLKVAPQMKLIIDTLAKNGKGKEVSSEELTKQVVAAGLVTRQPPERIVGYYTKPISELGFIKVEKVAAAPKKKKEGDAAAGNAPAATPKPAKAA